MGISNLRCRDRLCRTPQNAAKHHGLLASLRRPGLSLKLLLIVVGVSLAGVLGSSLLVLTLQQQQLTMGAQAATNRLSDAIEASLEHAMMDDDQAVIRQTVQAVVGAEDAEAIRVLDAEGRVQVSSRSGEVGTQFTYDSAECQFCHPGGQRPSNDTTRFIAADGQERLLNVNLIRNQPACYDCHDADTHVLGILMIAQPLTELQQHMASVIPRVGLAALATFVFLAGLMLLALRKLVTRPVAVLTEGLAEVGAGNLDVRVQVASGDELGELAAAFDTMREQLKASQAQAERHARDLAMLNEVAIAAGQTLDLRQILDLALDTVVNRLGMHAALIFLRDSETGRYTLRASLGATPEQCAEITRRRQQPRLDVPQQVVNSAQVLLLPRMSADPRFQGVWGDEDRRSYVNVPLTSKGAVVGSMGMISRVGHLLSPDEAQVLEAVGHEVGIAIDNALLLDETWRNEQQATTLYRLGTVVSGSLDLSQILDAVASGARELLGADLGLVGLADEDGQHIHIRAWAGNRTRVPDDLAIALTAERAAALSSGRPLVLESFRPRLLGTEGAEFFAEEGVASLVVVPLWRGERLHGLIGAAARRQRRFAEGDVMALVQLSHQVVASVENAQLYEQVRRMAMLEERDRLAREMHDNLAQALGYLNLKASMTDWLVESGHLEEARHNLRELKETSMSAYRDVREAIFGLRIAASLGDGFVPTLRGYLEEYRAHYGVHAELLVEAQDLSDLPVETGLQVTRIVQEALTNVRRHAGIDHARVRIAQQGEWLEITIEDEGRGFDLSRKGPEGRQCYGLQVMRERAASVGGELAIESRPGAGTRVRVRVPLAAGS